VNGVESSSIACDLVASNGLGAFESVQKPPLCGAPRFPFYRPRGGTASSFFSYRRVLLVLQMMMEAAQRRDPVRHWCYRRALSVGHGVPSRPGARHGQKAPLTGAVRGLGSIVSVRPALLRRACQGMARRGHGSRRGMPAPFLTLRAWSWARAITS
jgi:hypothetical protein